MEILQGIETTSKYRWTGWDEPTYSGFWPEMNGVGGLSVRRVGEHLHVSAVLIPPSVPLHPFLQSENENEANVFIHSGQT